MVRQLAGTLLAVAIGLAAYAAAHRLLAPHLPYRPREYVASVAMFLALWATLTLAVDARARWWGLSGMVVAGLSYAYVMTTFPVRR
jgi:Ca2+/Na+ antiporter